MSCRKFTECSSTFLCTKITHNSPCEVYYLGGRLYRWQNSRTTLKREICWLGDVLREYFTQLQKDGKKQRWVGGGLANHLGVLSCPMAWKRGLRPNIYKLLTTHLALYWACMILFNPHTVLCHRCYHHPHFVGEKTNSERLGSSLKGKRSWVPELAPNTHFCSKARILYQSTILLSNCWEGQKGSPAFKNRTWPM